MIEIGEACGFGNLSPFNRQFRQRCGATPMQVHSAVAAPSGGVAEGP